MVDLITAFLTAWGQILQGPWRDRWGEAWYGIPAVTTLILSLAVLLAGLGLAWALRRIPGWIAAEKGLPIRALAEIAVPGLLGAVWTGTLVLTLAPALSAFPAALRLLAVGTVLALLILLLRFLLGLTGRLGEILSRSTGGTANPIDDLLVDLGRRVLKGLLPLAAIWAVARILSGHPWIDAVADRLFALAVTLAIAWVAVQAVSMLDRFLLVGHRLDQADNLAARRILTRVTVVKKVLYLLIGILSLAWVLMQFDGVRQIGASILASAGVLSLVVGFAAQRTIANLLAGLQIALTQPIRLDDVVIVEGEWGRIEEITLTYVVVAIWDQRRLVLPISHFIEKPFQNWTRRSAEILGTVTLQVDPALPVDEMRIELARLLDGNPLWDGRVSGIQVTEARERSMEVRILVSAADASKAWDLRCLLREKLLAWLAARRPGSLPLWRWQEVMSGTGT